MTIQLLPKIEFSYSKLDLSTTLAGVKIKSESKFYSEGYRYQNFYLDGTLGD